MTQTPLKQRRQELDLTQVEVAKAIGVSQPTYQNYEAGTMAIPEAKLKRLAKVLRITKDEILGRPKAVNEALESRELPDDVYWGEITIHFRVGVPLVLSISYQEYKRLFAQLQDDGQFFHVTALSNQLVAVRRAAVTDVYLAEDGSDTFGPEHDSYDADAVGMWPSTPAYWHVVEELLTELDEREEIEARYGKDAVTEIARAIGLDMPSDIDWLIEAGQVEPKDRESTLAEAERMLDKMRRLTTDVMWQLSDGKVRYGSARDGDLGRYWWMEGVGDPQDQGPMIVVDVEDAQTAFVNPDELNYISIPEHRYRATMEEEMNSIADLADEEAAKPSRKPSRKR
jgi:transcriptional regulator with XRE-family HTH domain